MGIPEHRKYHSGKKFCRTAKPHLLKMFINKIEIWARIPRVPSCVDNSRHPKTTNGKLSLLWHGDHPNTHWWHAGEFICWLTVNAGVVIVSKVRISMLTAIFPCLVVSHWQLCLWRLSRWPLKMSLWNVSVKPILWGENWGWVRVIKMSSPSQGAKFWVRAPSLFIEGLLFCLKNK